MQVLENYSKQLEAKRKMIDTGEGIDPEFIPRLTERFFRVDKGRSREDGGTGLGLAIIKHLTELHGGTIDVESVVDTGTMFTIRLPRETEVSQDSQESTSEPPIRPQDAVVELELSSV